MASVEQRFVAPFILTEENTMSHLSNALAILSEDVITIQVVFKATKDRTFTYKALREHNIEVGDVVVVPAAREGITYSLARVVGVDDYCNIQADTEILYKWIVCKVDPAQHTALLERDNKVHDLAKASMVNAEKEKARAMLESTLAINDLKLALE